MSLTDHEKKVVINSIETSIRVAEQLIKQSRMKLGRADPDDILFLNDLKTAKEKIETGS